MIDLAAAPVPLTSRQWIAVAVATAAVAVTRVVAIACGPWDWDEMLFLLGLADYDVALHHPHPPGFPLFILSARILAATGLEPFRALQAVNLIASVCLVPATIFLCRELRFRFNTAMGAALILAFLPNVWFFGGTGFSDVAAVVLAITACALLLQGARSPGALIGGALVLAIACGFRPQNLLVGCLAALTGFWSQIRQRRAGAAFTAAVVGAAVLFLSYAGAVAATGEWVRYRDAAVAHQRYLAEVDSFLSETRPSLLQISDDFFFRPFRFPAMNTVLAVLALISATVSVARRRWPVLRAAGSFGPFWILAWLTLDFHSASRFSIGYMPLLAIMASDGIDLLTARARSERVRRTLFLGGAAAVTAALFGWSLPAVWHAHRTPSPPVAAVEFIRANVPEASAIYVQKRLRPFAEYYLPDRRLVHVDEDLPPFARAQAQPAVYLREGMSRDGRARTFAWPRTSLWNLARRRYFTVSVVPLDERR